MVARELLHTLHPMGPWSHWLRSKVGHSVLIGCIGFTGFVRFIGVAVCIGSNILSVCIGFTGGIGVSDFAGCIDFVTLDSGLRWLRWLHWFLLIALLYGNSWELNLLNLRPIYVDLR